MISPLTVSTPHIYMYYITIVHVTISYLPSMHVNFEFLADVTCAFGAKDSRRSDEEE
jgi:hypothetical protein